MAPIAYTSVGVWDKLQIMSKIMGLILVETFKHPTKRTEIIVDGKNVQVKP